MHRRARRVLALTVVALVASAFGTPATAKPDASSGGDRPSTYWTAERVAQAVPRDLVIDHRGLGYLRHENGALSPHGHTVAAERAPLRSQPTPGATSDPAPRAPATNDTSPPVIGDVDPTAGATIGATHTFTAVVTDADSGVKSVTFVITYPGGTQTQSFGATRDGDLWRSSLQGFTDGEWSWQVVAKDNAKRGGNTVTSASTPFTVNTSGGGGDGDGTGGVVTNAQWTHGGAVQTAAGRIYFEMPANRRLTRWQGYVCSGTVATDDSTGRSVIITAAHCVYDDVNKVFARNVLFIPNQAATTGGGTDLNCGNDALGCWEPSFGVVDEEWTTTTFPSNIPWDYAYYVVSDTGSHVGNGTDGALDGTAGSLAVQFELPTVGAMTHALGYSYSEDPKFMYCAEAMGTEGTANWWLASCLLSGGSSGGPWVQPMQEETGSGPVISVNSWGYTDAPGMAGPKLSETSAGCLFTAAKETNFDGVTGRGVVPSGC